MHITVNTTKLPRRRGKSNVPYVFSARGRAHLSQRPLPRPLFTRSILHTLSSSPAGPSRLGSYASRTTRRPNKNHSKPNPIDLFGDVDEGLDQKTCTLKSKKYPFLDRLSAVSRLNAKTRRNHPTILVDDSDEGNEDGEDEDAYNCPIDPVHWNRSHYAFGRYFLSFIDPRGRSYADLEDEYFEEKVPYDPFENDDEEGDEYVEEGVGVRCSTPGLTSSSSLCGSSLPPSSPVQDVSSSPALQHSITFDDDDEPSSVDLLSLSPNSSLELHPSIIASHYPNKKYTFTPAPPISRKHRLQLERMERRMERGKLGTYLCEYDEVVDDEVDELIEEEDECINDEGIGKWVLEGEAWDPFGDEEEI